MHKFINFMQLVAIHDSDMKKKSGTRVETYAFKPYLKSNSHSLVSIQFNLISFRTWASNHNNLHDHHCLNRPLRFSMNDFLYTIGLLMQKSSALILVGLEQGRKELTVATKLPN